MTNQQQRKITALLGLQWGDEGKGKIVDVLTQDHDVIARFQGGPNAGHTLEFNGMKHVLHIIPSGIFHKDKINLIGNGVLIEPVIFNNEVKELAAKGVDDINLYIADKASLILPTHRMMDAANEQAKGESRIGSTLKGIGPAYTDKIARVGIRVGDIMSSDFAERYGKLRDHHLMIARAMGFDVDTFHIGDLTLEEYEQEWMKSLETLKNFRFVNCAYFINKCLKEGKKVLAEGAQAAMLDIDHGTYPFVTSSSTITAGVCSGLGVPTSAIGEVIGVTKAYCTRVGAGPFPTELFDQTGLTLCEIGQEYGATTGRERRCGWIDLVALRYAIMLNGVTKLIVTKPDVMNDFDEVKMCTSYCINGRHTDEIPYEYNTANVKPEFTSFKGWNQSLVGITTYDALPERLKAFLNEIEHQTGVPISGVSTSPDRKDVIWK